MFTAAYIAGLQAFVIPGLLVLALMRPLAEPTFKWESVIIVSALFNIWTVLLVHFLGLQLYLAFWPLLGLELLLLCLLYSRHPRNINWLVGGTLTLQTALVGLIALVLVTALAAPYIGEIVHHWDAYAVWHPWATRLATAQPLGSTLSYPLGFPALASLIYAFNFNSTEFTEFTRFIPLLTLLISFLIGVTLCRYVSFVGAAFYVVALFAVYSAINAKMGGYILSLTADQTVAAFFALSTILLFITVRDEGTLSRVQVYTNLVIVGLSVAVTALIKQSGVPLVLCLCAFYLVCSEVSLRERLLRAAAIAVVVFVCAGIWYIVEIGGVYLSSGEFHYSKLASDRRHPDVGPDKAYRLVIGHTKEAVHLLWVSAVLSLFNRRAAALLLFVIVPNVVVFVFASSYAFRHFIIVTPAILAIGGIGLSTLVDRLEFTSLATRSLRILPFDVAAITAIPLILAVVLDGTITGEMLRAHQKSQVYTLGWRHHNELGIDSLKDVQPGSYFFSNYHVLGKLPEFEKVKFQPGVNLRKIVEAAKEDPSKPVRVLIIWYARQPEKLHEQVDCLKKMGGAKVIGERARGKTAPASYLLIDVAGGKGGLERCLS